MNADTISLPPLSVLLDQHAALDPGGSMDLVSDNFDAKSSTKRKPMKKLPGSATRLLCRALFWSILAILPYKDTSIWMPSSTGSPTDTIRCYSDSEQQFFYWDSASGRAAWALDPGLWPGATTTGLRLLVLNGDEGSTGMSLFFYLAAIGMRCLFWRDPAHRLSNAFTGSLRSNRLVWKSTLDMILVHKFRRAPYGSGRFWRQAKETIEILRDNSIGHPILAMLLPEIANDWRISVSTFDSHSNVKKYLSAFISGGIGQRVECRRWFTVYIANQELDQLWHTLLLSLILKFLLDGESLGSCIAREGRCVSRG